MSSLITVVTAIASALMLGISSVADQRSTKRVESRRALSPRILLDLVRQPLWVTALGANLVGFALQVVALSFGSLALVQPILVCDLIFAVLILWYLRRPGIQLARVRGMAAITATSTSNTGSLSHLTFGPSRPIRSRPVLRPLLTSARPARTSRCGPSARRRDSTTDT